MTTPDPDHERSAALDDRFADPLALIDESVAYLSDADVERGLHRVLTDCGYTPIAAPPQQLLAGTSLGPLEGIPSFTEVGLCLDDLQQLRAAADAALIRARQSEQEAEQRRAAAEKDAEQILQDAFERASARAASTMQDAQRKAAAIVEAAERDAAGILAQALEQAWMGEAEAVGGSRVPALPVVELVWPAGGRREPVAELHTASTLPVSSRPQISVEPDRSREERAGGIPVLVWYPHLDLQGRAGQPAAVDVDAGRGSDPSSTGRCRAGAPSDAAGSGEYVVHTSALVLIDEDDRLAGEPVSAVESPGELGAAAGTAAACAIGAETVRIVDDNGQRVTEHLVAALTEQGHTAVVVRDRAGRRVMGCMVALIRRIRHTGESRGVAGPETGRQPAQGVVPGRGPAPAEFPDPVVRR